MRIEPIAAAVLLASFTGAIGYYSGATSDRPVTELPRDAFVASEYLVSSEAFSEVERVHAMLDALAMRYVEQAQRLMVQDYLSRTGRDPVARRQSNHRMFSAVGLLEEGIAEFRGTKQELLLVPTFLYALKREGLYDRWLDTYLDTLYRHPTAVKVANSATEAMRIARVIGREQELAFGIPSRMPSCRVG